MTLWMILIAVGLVALVVAMYFATKKNMQEGLTPPGPIDSREQFNDFSDKPDPEVHPGESSYETEAESVSDQAKDLGHG